MKSGDDIRDIIFLNRCSFVVKRVAVCFHIIKPDVIRSASIRFRKNKHTCRYTSIWLKNTAWHTDDCFQFMVFYQFLSDRFMRIGCTEQYTIRHNRCTTSAFFKETDKQTDK